MKLEKLQKIKNKILEEYMNKKIFYLILLPIYEILGTFISYKFMPGEKAGLIIALI